MINTKEERINMMNNIIVLDFKSYFSRQNNGEKRVKAIKSYCMYYIKNVYYIQDTVMVYVNKYRSNIYNASPRKDYNTIDSNTFRSFIDYESDFNNDTVKFSNIHKSDRIAYDIDEMIIYLIDDINKMMKGSKVKEITIVTHKPEVLANNIMRIDSDILNHIKFIKFNSDDGENLGYKQFTRRFLHHHSIYKKYKNNSDFTSYILMLNTIKGVIYDRELL